MESAPRVLVIGAGVAGLVAATQLQARGAAITLVSRPEVASRASHFAGGMLAPWCEAAEAGAEVARLGAGAIGWWQAHAPRTQRNGSLVLAPRRDVVELERFARRTSHHTRLEGEGLAALEPDLAGRFETGLFFAEEAHLDPREALSGLACALEERGATRIQGAVEEMPARDFDHVVDCRGHAAHPDLPGLRAVRGEMLLLRCPDITLSRPVRLLHPRIPLYIVPRGGGVFMVGATMVESAHPGPITARSAMELLNAAYALHPAFGEAEILESGTGLRPAFADNMPQVLRRQGRWHLNGLHRNGFLLSPVLASELCDRMLGHHREGHAA